MIAYESWGLALLHFVWQGALVAAGLYAALRALAGRRPEVRYAICLGALIVMASLPVFTLWRLEAAGRADPVVAEPSLVQSAGNGLVDPAPDGTARPAGLGGIGGDAVAAGSGAESDLARADSGIIEWLRAAFEPVLGWIVGLWAFGVLLLSVRVLGGWVRLRKLTGLDVAAVPEAVRERATVIAARLAVSRPVRLVRSARVAVPSVVGWLRPVILLPVSALTGLSPAQLEAVLAHELAHIRRHDYLVNLVQTLIETLLFYHPAVWWVSHRIREEREHCCDDLAVSVCGDRRLYAGALIELETLRVPRARLAVAADGTSLVARVRRLLDPDSLRMDGVLRWPAALSAALVAITMAVACAGDSILGRAAEPAGTAARDTPATALVFIGEAFADKVFRYEVSADGNAVLDHEITTNVSQPGGIAFSPSGEMFVSNRSGSVARFLDPEGAVRPNGVITADNTGAPFGQPHWLTFRDGELFLAQESGTVLRFTFDADGHAVFNGTLIAGGGTRGIQTNPLTGEVLVSNLGNTAHRFAFDANDNGTPNGRVSGGGMNHIHGMAFTPWGELLVANHYGDSVSRFVFDAEGNAVPNGVISGGEMRGPIDLDISPWGELFVTNHNQVPGVVTRWVFSTDDASAVATRAGSFTVPGNLGGIRFASR